jgi:hypothetical protein
LILGLLTIAAACSGDTPWPEGIDGEVEEMGHTVSGLAPGATYHWKIIAHAAPETGFSSETVVFRFTTGG